MDPTKFDELTKALANSTSRRQALKTIVATTIGSILGLAGIGTAFAKCKQVGEKCAHDHQCCSGLVCQNDQCVTPCVTNGNPCSPTQTCCSGICDFATLTCVSCLPNGDFPCHVDSDCCQGLCDEYSGTCGCVPNGMACSRPADCCSGVCQNGGCVP